VITGVVDEATVAVVPEIEAAVAVVVKCPSAQLGEGMATVETSGVVSAAEVVIEVVVIFSAEESSDMVVDAAVVIISAFWTTEGTCFDFKQFAIGYAIVNIMSDFAGCLMPIPRVWNM
jgi:hypothetical protein